MAGGSWKSKGYPQSRVGFTKKQIDKFVSDNLPATHLGDERNLGTPGRKPLDAKIAKEQAWQAGEVARLLPTAKKEVKYRKHRKLEHGRRKMTICVNCGECNSRVDPELRVCDDPVACDWRRTHWK